MITISLLCSILAHVGSILEGLGSIYWHMVSKLLLANYEVVSKAIELGEAKKWIDRLIDHYYKIFNGIGPKKSPGHFLSI